MMRILPIFLLIAVNLAHAAIPLQPLIDATPSGASLVLLPGEYTGPVLISRPVVLDGSGKAHLNGNGSATVLALKTNGAVIRGMVISGSGDSSDRMDAGILVEGNRNRIEANQLKEVFFGIHIKQGQDNYILDNQIHGKNLPLGQRGDGLRLWNSRRNLIQGNYFRQVRDLTFANSPDNTIIGNSIENARQGMEFVFSPRARVEENKLEYVDSGIVVLYSSDLVLNNNHIAHALDGSGAGITFKDSGAGRIEGNKVMHCAVGFSANTPPNGGAILTIQGNRFIHNIIGVKFYGEAGGHQLFGNNFEHNLTQVMVSAVGAGRANVWRGNYWSDYQGFDRNDDGTGDTAHEMYLYADRIWFETPMATFFRNSPSLELLDFLERLAPFASPGLILRDDNPRINKR